MNHCTGQDDRQNLIDAALAELKNFQLVREQVRRVAVGRTGDVHIEAHRPGQQVFLRYESGCVHEIHPLSDDKIPFTRRLAQPGAAASHKIVSYRPGRRMVVEAVSGSDDVMIKAYRRHKARQAHEKYAIALSATEGGGFDVPALLRVDPDNDYLLMEKREGQTPAILASAAGTWRETGECLRRFQGYPAAGSLNEFTHEQELAVLGERARRYRLCFPDMPDDWTRCHDRLELMAATLPPGINALSHRDLHDRQLIVGDHGISLLDFDLLCVADAALDPANLLAHMTLRTLQQGKPPGSALHACRESFLQGLHRHGERGFEHRRLFYEAGTFLRLALLYALRPRWKHLTPALVDEGRDRLDRAVAVGVDT